MKKLTFFYYTILTIGTIFHTQTGLATTKLSIPDIQKSHTVKSLLTLIQSNNPKASFFIVKDGNWKEAKTTTRKLNINTIINNNLNTLVTLSSDENLIQDLIKDNRLRKTDQKNYAKILLYFSLNDPEGTNYRFYLVNPCPAKIVKSVLSTTYEAKNILDKWILD